MSPGASVAGIVEFVFGTWRGHASFGGGIAQ